MPDDPPLHIRPAALGDIPAITAIYAHHVVHGLASWELEPPDEAEIGRRLTDLVVRGYPYLVAQVGTTLAGYAYAGPYRVRPGYRYTVEDSIYVAPAHQRRGYARRLLEDLITAATTRGFRQMVAVIGDSANQPSIALHASLGFTHIGTLTGIGYKHGRWLDSVLMQRPLGPGNSSPP